MSTSIYFPAVSKGLSVHTSKNSVVKKFITWCTRQEDDRLLWQGFTLTFHGCVLTPISMLMALLSGVNPFLYVPVIAAIAITFISNLATLPTKYTLPIFFLSVLIDLAVITAAVISGLDFSRLF